MNPRSIAVVGASERQDAIGTRVIRNLRSLGYKGRIYPVNPRYATVADLPCFPSLSALPERVDAAFLAVHKAQQQGHETQGAVLGSDAYFPFRDGVDQAADAGVTAIVQPGGSVRDPEVIAAANERKIAMIFTGKRQFRH